MECVVLEVVEVRNIPPIVPSRSAPRMHVPLLATMLLCSHHRFHWSEYTAAGDFLAFACARCSSANTLRIQRLDFDREQLTKGPDVIRHDCRHRRCLLPPSGTNRSMAYLLVLRQRLLQAHVGSGHIVEGL